jgi:hypothetical protein
MEDNTLKERYVELDTAKLLKEKGFNIPVSMAYDNYGIEGKIYDTFGYNNHNKHDDLISAPTQALVLKYLRETYDIIVTVMPARDKDNYLAFMYSIIAMDESEGEYDEVYLSGLYENLEECTEDGIVYCFENLVG